MGITLEQAKQLEYGDILYSNEYVGCDQSPKRYKVNGKPKIWKRDPNRIRVPLKHGLYAYGELTNGTHEGGSFTFYLEELELEESIAIDKASIAIKGD